MIDFDATVVVQMINFAIFLFILRAILFKPLINHIEQRRNYISSNEKKVSDNLKKLEESEKNYRAQLDTARKKAQDLINSNISIAEEEKQSIVKAAIDETKNVYESFRQELEQETINLRTKLQPEIDAFAEEIAGKVLSVNIPDEKLLVQGGNH